MACFQINHKKKLIKAGKKKGYKRIIYWVKGIRRHLYWCATSTKQGFEQLILAKWKSFMRHVANRHTNHPDKLFQNCAHEEIQRRKWIKIGNNPGPKVIALMDIIILVHDKITNSYFI